MSDRLNPEAVFLEHLGWIEKVASMAARRHGLWGADAEDFASWVKIKLMADDYAIFRKFRGEADWKTFIATVVVRHSHNYSRERRGRWRPSATAERAGPPLRELETLVYRDGYTLAEAGERLRTAGLTALSDGGLARLLARVPQRGPMRPVEVAADPVLEAREAGSSADAGLAEAETTAWRAGLLAALHRAMESMTHEERMIVRMHFADGLSVADVARALGIDQRPLYRRIPRLRTTLRSHLEREGVSAREVRELLDREVP